MPKTSQLPRRIKPSRKPSKIEAFLVPVWEFGARGIEGYPISKLPGVIGPIREGTYIVDATDKQAALRQITTNQLYIDNYLALSKNNNEPEGNMFMLRKSKTEKQSLEGHSYGSREGRLESSSLTSSWTYLRLTDL